jgi:hypothetical protein
MKENQSHEARRRAFIRDYHPDRGGDPGAFIAGLRTLDAEREQGSGPLPKVVVVRRRAWLVRKATVVVRRLRYGPRPSRVRLLLVLAFQLGGDGSAQFAPALLELGQAVAFQVFSDVIEIDARCC